MAKHEQFIKGVKIEEISEPLEKKPKRARSKSLISGAVIVEVDEEEPKGGDNKAEKPTIDKLVSMIEQKNVEITKEREQKREAKRRALEQRKREEEERERKRKEKEERRKKVEEEAREQREKKLEKWKTKLTPVWEEKPSVLEPEYVKPSRTWRVLNYLEELERNSLLTVKTRKWLIKIRTGTLTKRELVSAKKYMDSLPMATLIRYNTLKTNLSPIIYELDSILGDESGSVSVDDFNKAQIAKTLIDDLRSKRNLTPVQIEVLMRLLTELGITRKLIDPKAPGM